MKKMQEVIKNKSRKYTTIIYCIINSYFILGLVFSSVELIAYPWINKIFALFDMFNHTIPFIIESIPFHIFLISLVFYSYYMIKNKFNKVKYLAWGLLIFYSLFLLKSVLIFFIIYNYQMPQF